MEIINEDSNILSAPELTEKVADYYAGKSATAVPEPPTPIRIVREANAKKLHGLKNGSSTKLEWEGKSIRVTLTMGGHVGFFEEDVLAVLDLDDVTFPQTERIALREKYTQDGFFDPRDELLVLEPALYLYLFYNEFKTGNKNKVGGRFVSWVCKEVLSSIRVSSLYVEPDENSPNLYYDLIERLDMNQKLDKTRMNHWRNENAAIMEELRDSHQAMFKRVNDLAAVIHSSAFATEDDSGVAKSKVNKPKREKPVVTDEQRHLFLILHEQLACATGTRRTANAVLKSRYQTKYWNPEDKKYSNNKGGTILDKIASIVHTKQELEGGVDAFLETCKEVIQFNGLTPVTLDAWQEGLNMLCRTPKVAKRDIVEHNDSNNFGSNLHYIDVAEIKLKD